MTTQVTAPVGIPEIPAGAQLGGAGTQENHAQVPATSPLTPNAVAPVQQPAPVVQPVQPVQQPFPVQQPAPVPATPEKVYVNPYAPVQEVSPTDSYVDTSIAHLTTELGVSAEAFDAVIDSAIEHQDLKLINPHALGKQLTPEQAQRVQQLAIVAVQQANHEIALGVAQAKQAVHGVAGGEAQWNTAVQAFNANAPKEVQEYAAYLADHVGDLKKAAEYVIGFNAQNGFTNQVTQAPLSGGTGGVQNGLSKAEYSAELAKLEMEIGNRSFNDPMFAGRMADLDARRALGRQQGR